MAAAFEHSDEETSLVDEVARTLIVGLGATGASVARYLAERGEPVRIVDSRREPPGLGMLGAQAVDMEIVLESLDPSWLEGVDRLVLSPGLAGDIAIVAAARERGIPVVGDIELFALAAQAPVLAVTGSNGKSTVTTLTERMLTAQGFSTLAGGNLGPPALDLLTRPCDDAYVLEISSFQMETTTSLRPLRAAVLNVSADHLDRHGSLDRYAALKQALLTAAETAVFNWDDPLVRAMGLAHPRAVPFSVAEPLEHGYSVVDRSGERWLARHLDPLMPSRELAQPGTLGEANGLAALALAAGMRGPIGPALDVLRRFEGLPHRCSTVATVHGVVYVDDSKATNVAAAAAAIASQTSPVVLVAGGLSKGADFSPLAPLATERLRAAVLIGQAAESLERTFAGRCPTRRAANMNAAVATAAGLAEAGDVVLLAPACASQDMFVDYRDRGDQFARAVRALESAPGEAP